MATQTIQHLSANIKPGQHVLFSHDGQQSMGSVVSIKTDITNGQKIAEIQTQKGVTHHAPVTSVFKQNFAFLTGDVNPLPFENDRRFWVVKANQ